MSFNESTVESAALEWFGVLGYTIGHGPHLALDKPSAKRDSFDDEEVLVGRLREAIRRLKPAIPGAARATIRRFRIIRNTPRMQ